MDARLSELGLVDQGGRLRVTVARRAIDDFGPVRIIAFLCAMASNLGPRGDTLRRDLLDLIPGLGSAALSELVPDLFTLYRQLRTLPDGPELRREVARALSRLGAHSLRDALEPIVDRSDEVARAEADRLLAEVRQIEVTTTGAMRPVATPEDEEPRRTTRGLGREPPPPEAEAAPVSAPPPPLTSEPPGEAHAPAAPLPPPEPPGAAPSRWDCHD
jgi:hypothetical protein